jgi:uncharacterized protein YqhQ
MSPSSKHEEQSLAFGGQALIEGVMMRTNRNMVLCVRQPNNEISTQNVEITSLTQKYRFLGVPFLRGIIMLFETMYYGIRGIFYSANVALEEEEEKFTFRDYLLVVVMVVLMNGFFIVVPFILTNFLKLTGIFFNIVESGVRLSFFIIYLYLVSRWGEFTRILQYHGAEHKAINAHEAGASMDVDNVYMFSRLNPRCGTSFLFITMLISIALFAMIPKGSFIIRLLYRILLIPVIAAISYEVLKFSDKNRDSNLLKLIITPGLWFQHLTTKEPTKEMVEIAIEALDQIKKLNEVQKSS